MEPDVPARALTPEAAADVPPAPEAPPASSGAESPPQTEEPAPQPRSRAREYAEAILVAVVFALFTRTFLFQAFQVPTASMEKNILVGDHLIVNKFIFAPHAPSFLDRILPYRPVKRGDVLVFKFPEDPRRDFIKRTIALPGETVEIRDKVISVEGVLLEEPEVYHSDDRIWPDDPATT